MYIGNGRAFSTGWKSRIGTDYFSRSWSSLYSSDVLSNYYFFLFVLVHCLLWTLIPTFLRPTVPHDTLEGITWGMQWQWSYHKHPFVTAWLCAAITNVFGNVGWPVYLLAQIVVALTYTATFILARVILPPMHALIATLALEGVLFYNINTFNLTPDTMQSPLWALVTLCLYQALRTERIIYWLSTGVVAAVCICTKYQVMLLFICMLGFCVLNKQARLCFKNKGIYCAFGIMLLLCVPHLIWLYQHDFSTVLYALDTPIEYTPAFSFSNHFLYPLRFLTNNILNIILLFVLFAPFYTAKKANWNPSSFTKQFLLTIVLGPLLLSLIICISTGTYFTPRWSTPYYFALGIVLMVYLRPELTSIRVYLFATGFLFLSLGLPIGKAIYIPNHKQTNSDAYLPNLKIANYLTKLWHDRYHQPLPYLAGSNYLVAGITPYMPDKPIPYLGWELKDSPWIDEQNINKNGALFIWDEGDNYYWDLNSVRHDRLTPNVQARFPKLIVLPAIPFDKYFNKQPVLIGMAIVPPEKQF